MTDYEELFDDPDAGMTVAEVLNTTDDADEYPAEGPWHVRLLIPIEDADSPTAAVDEFIFDVSQFGLRAYLYRVTHVETGENYFVQGDRVMTEEEVVANFDDEEES